MNHHYSRAKRVSRLWLTVIAASLVAVVTVSVESGNPIAKAERETRVREFVAAFNARNIEAMLGAVDGNVQWLSVKFISLSVSGGQAGAELAQVTLYSVVGHENDFTRSSVNFESGERGFRGTASGFDLTYGNMTINYGRDWYRDWLVVRDPRSIVCDLGEKKWGDFRRTPSFPWKNWRIPLPLNSPMVFNASAGKKVDTPDGKESVSPHRQSVMARVGHMYLMRVMRGRSETYVMFRVESLTPGDNCVLSWKKVTAPEDDVEK